MAVAAVTDSGTFLKGTLLGASARISIGGSSDGLLDWLLAPCMYRQQRDITEISRISQRFDMARTLRLLAERTGGIASRTRFAVP